MPAHIMPKKRREKDATAGPGLWAQFCGLFKRKVVPEEKPKHRQSGDHLPPP